MPFSGYDDLNPAFAGSLYKFLGAAPGGGITPLSGYRSPERQRQLWEASDKSGHMVAAPGHSQHNFGRAVDLRYVNDAARQWAHANAGAYGLTFPMDYEPWHIEPIGARQQGKAPEDVASSSAPATTTTTPLTSKQPIDVASSSAPATTTTPLTSKQPIEDWRAGGMPVSPVSGMPQPQDEWLQNLSLQNFGMDDFTRAVLTGEDWSRALIYNTIRGLFA